MFGKNHLNLITFNIIRAYGKLQAGEWWVPPYFNIVIVKIKKI
jgi:hypothetical protein